MKKVKCAEILAKRPDLVCCPKCHAEGDPSYYFQLNDGDWAAVCCFIATSAEQGELEELEELTDV